MFLGQEMQVSFLNHPEEEEELVQYTRDIGGRVYIVVDVEGQRVPMPFMLTTNNFSVKSQIEGLTAISNYPYVLQEILNIRKELRKIVKGDFDKEEIVNTIQEILELPESN